MDLTEIQKIFVTLKLPWIGSLACHQPN